MTRAVAVLALVVWGCGSSDDADLTVVGGDSGPEASVDAGQDASAPLPGELGGECAITTDCEPMLGQCQVQQPAGCFQTDAGNAIWDCHQGPLEPLHPLAGPQRPNSWCSFACLDATTEEICYGLGGECHCKKTPSSTCCWGESCADADFCLNNGSCCVGGDCRFECVLPM